MLEYCKIYNDCTFRLSCLISTSHLPRPPSRAPIRRPGILVIPARHPQLLQFAQRQERGRLVVSAFFHESSGTASAARCAGRVWSAVEELLEVSTDSFTGFTTGNCSLHRLA